MKRILALGAALILLMCLSLWVGCGDDDEGTTTPALTQGDTLDPVFLSFRDGYENVDQFTSMMLDIMFSVADSVLSDPSNPNAKAVFIPNGLDVEADSLYLTYHASSGYWYLYEGYYDPRDSAIIIDSVQFLHGATPVQWPDSAQLSGIKSGLSLFWSIEGDVVTGSHNMTLTGDFPNFGIVTANGTQHVSYAYHDSHVEVVDDTLGCDFDMTFNSTITNVAFPLGNIEDVCPQSGSLVHMVTVDVGCVGETDTLDYSGGWKVTLTFAGATSTWVIENATTRWSGTDSCSSSVSGNIRLPDRMPVFHRTDF